MDRGLELDRPHGFLVRLARCRLQPGQPARPRGSGGGGGRADRGRSPFRDAHWVVRVHATVIAARCMLACTMQHSGLAGASKSNSAVTASPRGRFAHIHRACPRSLGPGAALRSHRGGRRGRAVWDQAGERASEARRARRAGVRQSGRQKSRAGTRHQGSRDPRVAVGEVG